MASDHLIERTLQVLNNNFINDIFCMATKHIAYRSSTRGRDLSAEASRTFRQGRHPGRPATRGKRGGIESDKWGKCENTKGKNIFSALDALGGTTGTNSRLRRVLGWFFFLVLSSHHRDPAFFLFSTSLSFLHS